MCACGGACADRFPSAPWAEKLADDHKIVTGVRPQGFMCPVCLRDLPISCSTPAHAPTKSLGGSVVTWCCRSCNNQMNRDWEQRAAQSFERTHRGTLRVPGMHPVPGRMRVRRASDGSLHVLLMHTDEWSKSGKTFGAAVEVAARGDFTLEFWEAKPEVRVRAFGSWVYLRAFAIYGYRFAYSPTCDGLRQAIRGARGVPMELREAGGEAERELLIVARAVEPDGVEWAFLGWSEWGGLLLWSTPHPDAEQSLRDLTRDEPLEWVTVADESINAVLAGGGDHGVRVYPDAPGAT